MDNTETWPWNKEHILRKDSWANLGHAKSPNSGGEPQASLQVMPGVLFGESKNEFSKQSREESQGEAFTEGYSEGTELLAQARSGRESPWWCVV